MSALKVISVSELIKQTRQQRDFGGWHLDQRQACVYYVDPAGRELYWIGLGRCRTSAAVLDWIAQVSHKTWASPTCVAGLVRILDDVLHLQASLCSCGRERGPIDAVAFVRRRQKVRA
jgi:hypothetical protein